MKKIKTQTKKNSKKNLGFSLVELMVTMSIVGILSAVTIASSNSARSGRAISLAVDTIVTDIRATQALALAGGMAYHNIKDTTGNTIRVEKPPCAFSFVFDVSESSYGVHYYPQNQKGNVCGDPDDFENDYLMNTVPVRHTQSKKVDLKEIDSGLEFKIVNDSDPPQVISNEKHEEIGIFKLPGGEKYKWIAFPGRNRVNIMVYHRSNKDIYQIITVEENGFISY